MTLNDLLPLDLDTVKDAVKKILISLSKLVSGTGPGLLHKLIRHAGLNENEFNNL
jgi:hypothetical protein